MSEFTFLDVDQIFGENQLDIFKKYGTRCAITDFSILLGGIVREDTFTSEGNRMKDRTSWWWTKTPYYNDSRVVYYDGGKNWCDILKRHGGARPAIPYSSISQNCLSKERTSNGILEVEYGEYPQTIVPEYFAKDLEDAYERGIINKTGKNYITNSINCGKYNFRGRKHAEYEFRSKKYKNNATYDR